jgi:hypothetical protein
MYWNLHKTNSYYNKHMYTLEVDLPCTTVQYKVVTDTFDVFDPSSLTDSKRLRESATCIVSCHKPQFFSFLSK